MIRLSACYLGVLVAGVIVRDDVNIRMSRIVLVDLSKKRQVLLVTMFEFTVGKNLSICNIQCRIKVSSQTTCSIAVVDEITGVISMNNRSNSRFP